MDFNLPGISMTHEYVLVDTSAMEYRRTPSFDRERIEMLRRTIGKFNITPPIDDRMAYAQLMKDMFAKNFYLTAAMVDEYMGLLGRLHGADYSQGKRLKYRNTMARSIRSAARNRTFPFSQGDIDTKTAIEKYFAELRHDVSQRDIDLIFSTFALSRRGRTALLTNDRPLVDTFASVSMHISLDRDNPVFSGFRRTDVYMMNGSESFYRAAGSRPVARLPIGQQASAAESVSNL